MKKKKKVKGKETLITWRKLLIFILFYFLKIVSIKGFICQSLFDQACLYQCLQVMQQEAFGGLLLLITFFQSAFFLLIHAKGGPSVGFLCDWCWFGIAVPEWVHLWRMLQNKSSFFRLSLICFERAFCFLKRENYCVTKVTGSFLHRWTVLVEGSFGKQKLFIFYNFFC